ncbi:hypothetical protein AGMMS49579_24430 [Spirochaetia bacterium]|nr:hypothetical protein AGMMS49579_24430 [Spirochaetia bacterium]
MAGSIDDNVDEKKSGAEFELDDPAEFWEKLDAGKEFHIALKRNNADEPKRYFTKNGAPPDTVLYFIPSISLTMAFADARGIPNEFYTQTNGGPFSLNGTLTIPLLHNKMVSGMRTNMQLYNISSINPKYGIDANRDYYFSLESSKRFADFIQSLTDFDVRQKQSVKYNGNLTVFMMHGYDSTKANNNYGGSVYGQYTVKPGFIGEIPSIIIKYIGFITKSLFNYENKYTNNKDYFYRSDNAMEKYQGEWAWHLYGKDGDGKPGILSFDIELGEEYREGERGAGGARRYNVGKVGKETLPFFKDASGYFIPEDMRTEDTLFFIIFC